MSANLYAESVALPKPADADPLPANHREKRAQILEATKQVLLRDGPAACTSRAVASEIGINKALMHYYFSSWDEVVDRAMTELLGGMVARIRAAARAGSARSPEQRFVDVVTEYFAVFAEQQGLSLLWFDYWVSATRAGRGEQFVRIGDDLVALLQELLAEAGFSEPEVRARILFSYVIGALVRGDLHGGSFEEMQREVQWLSTLAAPRPAPRQKKN
jgi:AcrR family transcriptional regulator